MTPRERFVSCMTFRPVDRCFLKPDGYLPATILRWEQEGLPKGVDPNDYFGWDPREFVRVNMECCPGFPERVVYEDAEYLVKTNSEGITFKERKDRISNAMPEFTDWPVKTRDDYLRMKEQYQARITERYPKDYAKKLDFWNNDCTNPVAFELRGMPFHRLRMWMGLEGLCMAMYDNPAWVHEMVEFLEDFLLKVSERALSEVKADYVYACDDIAYKTAALISPAQFQEFFFASSKRVIDRVKRAGVPVIVMDSDGNLDEFAEIYRDVGFNVIIPIEVAAGNDALAMHDRLGRTMALQGGFDKRILAKDKAAIRDEVLRLYPRLMAEGGFTPNIDHDVPEDVPFENYAYYVELTKQVAEYPERYL
jgi:hypothetical protein